MISIVNVISQTAVFDNDSGSEANSQSAQRHSDFINVTLYIYTNLLLPGQRMTLRVCFFRVMIDIY